MRPLFRLSMFLVLTLLALSAWAATPIAVPTQQEGIHLRNATESGLSLSCGLPALESFDVQTSRGTFSQLQIPGFGRGQRLGEPSLPLTRQFIAVPLGATVRAEVLDSRRSEVNLADYGVRYPILPAQPSVAKNQNAADIPFAYQASAYATRGFGNTPLVRIEELGILHGLRLCIVEIAPVRYDPSAQKLEIYTDLEINVTFDGGDLAATRDLRARTYSPFYESMYGQYVLNYRQPTSLDTDLTRYPIKYVVVTDTMFYAQLQPFVQWKTKQGYKVIVGCTNNAAVGSTTTSIKNYLQNLYNAGTTGDPAPTFVLFCGDIAQIPAYTGTSGTHSTDLMYAQLAGSDVLPDVYYGRFSASSTAEMQPQIDKTLEYEKYLMPDPSYLGEVVMIAGADATYAPTYGNGQINYGTSTYFNVAHGISSHTHLYPQSASDDALVISEISDGVGFANYTAHGSETSWADPSLTVTNVNSMTNNHKYGTIVGNCCLTNSFQVATCLGEAWLRAANKGAIGYIGASNNSYWDEDYYWGVGYRTSIQVNPTYDATRPGAYDGMFHDHSETFPNWYTTQYGFNMAGNLAVTQSGSSRITYYWEIYHLMGDPSLTTYFGVPTANTVTYPATINIGIGTMMITAAPYSYVGLSKDNVLVAAGLADATGALTLTFTPFSTPGTAEIVITRQNRIPVQGTIQVIAASGPYVITTATQVTDPLGNSNGLADFGESVYLTISEQNVGTTVANAVNVTLTESDAYLTLDDASESYGNIAVNQTVAPAQGFRATLAANVPDGRVIPLSLTATDNASHTWTGTVNLTAHAPNVSVGTVIVDDPTGNNNGRLDPGETVGLDVSLTNNGSATVANLAALLSSADAYVTINDNSGSLTSLAPGATATVSFSITVGASAPVGHAAPFTVGITATNYTTSGGFTLTVGLVLEDFETNTFARFPWTQAGNLPWTLTNVLPQEGVYCAKSGAISDNQTSDLSVTLNVMTAGNVSFYYKVSSESTYDYLRFFIDGAQQAQWSGEVGWTQVSYAVNAGSHTFLWRYYKDVNQLSGSDCAWIDYVIFPAIVPPQYPDIALGASSFNVGVAPAASTTRDLTVSNSGDAALNFTATATVNSARHAVAPDETRDLVLTKDQVDPRHGYNSLDTQGGPDTFGYRWMDSNESGGPVYNWVEIATIGTRLSTTSDDQQFPVTLPWSFPFYGTNYTDAKISSNGNLHFSADTTDYGNRAIPSGRLPNAMIAPFSDDLSPQNGAGIYYYNDVANNRFIVQYDSIPHYGTTTVGVYTFEMILYSSGIIVFQYQSLSGAVNNCTVGIENGTGLDGLQVVYNAAYLTSNLAIRFSAVQPWLRIAPASGAVAPAGSTPLTVTFDANGLAASTYTGQITVSSNDPDEATVVVPVTFTVGTPTAVTDLVAYSVANDIILTWTPTNGASYRVYASADGVTFTDTGIVVTTPTCTLVDEVTTYGRRIYRVTTQW